MDQATADVGVTVTAWHTETYPERALERSLSRAVRHGVDTAVFAPSWFTSTVAATDVAPERGFTVSDASLLDAMACARDLGLRVVLKPLVDVLGYPVWRGTLDPPDRRRWWAGYGRMVEHYAELAQRADAGAYIVGTELEALTSPRDTEDWVALVAAVRERYDGALTYATNEYRDAERVGFWDRLDYLGFDLYPDLVAPGDPLPGVDALVRAWQEPVACLRALHERWDKPVLVAEVGFRSTASALERPWDWAATSPPDTAAQAVGYEATYRALATQPWLTALYWWEWPADLDEDARDPTSYSPFGKPAGDVVRRWARPAPSTRPEALPFVSVVVPVRNGARTIDECLAALVAGDYPVDRREIVVVDNGSTDDTAERVGALPVRLVEEPRVGRSHARNRGIRESSGTLVAFIDGDCVAEPSWLSHLVAGFVTEGIAGVAGEIVPEAPSTGVQRYMAAREKDWQGVVLELPERFAITANVAFRREAIERVGGFDPSFVTAEDVDFGWRFFAAGLRMTFCPEARVAHRMRATAWGMCRQQEGLGFGRALLRERYDLPRGYALPSREELRIALRELVRGDRSREQVRVAGYELMRMASLRTGALRFRATRRASRAAA